jgi:Ice-binding-like
MNSGVPRTHESHFSDSPAVSPPPVLRQGGKTFRVGLVLLGLLSTLFFASSAFGATATVGLGEAASFSVLAGSTVTNTGPTTMFGDLGLSPGSEVTGAPVVLGQTHVDDAVAIGAKNALTTAYNDAASRPSNGSAGTDLAGQTFLPGTRTASESLLLSSGTVTLDAQGDPNAVFIFQIGSTLTTEANTTVLLVNGAQACNVFWQVGSSATLGTGTHFVGTIMASASISATTGATIHGRLLAQTGAVTMDTNTITTSNCASSVSGSGGGLETTTGGTTGGVTTVVPIAPAGPGTPAGAGPAGGSAVTTAPLPPLGSRTTGKHGHPVASHRHRGRNTRRTVKRRSPARPALPHTPGAFTG